MRRPEKLAAAAVLLGTAALLSAGTISQQKTISRCRAAVAAADGTVRAASDALIAEQTAQSSGTGTSQAKAQSAWTHYAAAESHYLITRKLCQKEDQ